MGFPFGQRYYLRVGKVYQFFKTLPDMRLQQLVLILPALLWTCTAAGQGAQVEFGKNRVQYHRDFDEWSEYESEHFITYWYGEGRNTGQAAVQIAEQEYRAVQALMEHRINNKLQIVVYVDLTDIKQSNVGSEEAFTNTGGQTKIVGNKIFVYFDGDHNHLRRQIREGIASVFLDAMLFGSNLQEVVQNAVMLTLPEWFKQGLVSFVGEGWSAELDNQLKDAILQDDFPGFDRFATENPRLAGHAFWYYISDNFGANAVSNLLYLTRINRSVESGFLYVLGSSYKNVLEVWELYFRRRYDQENEGRMAPPRNSMKVKNKRNVPVSHLALSPNGRTVVYVLNDIGRFSVWMQDARSNERTLLLRSGTRNAFQATDYNYPLIAWNPNGKEVSVIFERKDVIKLHRVNTDTKKSETNDISSPFQRIHSLDYTSPTSLVFSATVRGFSDIYQYFIPTTQSERITNDIYDDLDAAFVRLGNQRGIIFASNRPDTLMAPVRLDSVLPLGQFDLFFYDLDRRTNELVRVTNTPFADEFSPVAVDSARFAYIGNRSGVANREVGFLEEYIHHRDQIIQFKDGSELIMHADSSLAGIDSTLIDSIIIRPVIKQRSVTHINSDYARSLLRQSASARSGRVAELVQYKGRHHIFVRETSPDSVFSPSLTKHQVTRLLAGGTADLKPEPPKTAPGPALLPEIPTPPPAPAVPDTGKVDIDNYLFQSEFDPDEKPSVTAVQKPENAEESIRVFIPEPPPQVKAAPRQEMHRFRPGLIIPSRLQFRTDFVTTQLDNSILFEGLESFSLNPQRFTYPVPGIMLKANFKDLLEDYELEGGLRLPTTFNGTEYFFTFNNKKRRIDHRFSVYRRNNRLISEGAFLPNRRELNTVLGQYGLRYPLDIFRSVRATATLRRDRLTQLATDLPALNTPSRSEQRIGFKLEYVFDNTLDIITNIKNGSRYKVYADFYKAFNLQIANGASFEFDKGFLGVLGFDARHYQRFLGKYPVLALRAAGATSFGSQRFLYYLGGVDNWVFPKFDESVPVADPNAQFAFQAFAGPMRGFDMNIRNGNSYMVINAEVRLPVFLMLSRRITSNFLRNFQVVGFFDAGTAWEGSNPFSTDNPLNSRIITNGDRVVVKLNYFREPVVAGYGAGLRTMLFGYFARVDYAWGIETRQIQKPKLYIALGLDF